ncbi:hypothetical protein [Carboxylicivirga caseinilyticus]|uniref:hypothetical protein n=1 Tax=Carboxylicivirga caseinilyticus TaxID=3417572 RepID=UPI003D3582F9|nr:hypothetical protein [Marinilabiliaceae bacterium A049]
MKKILFACFATVVSLSSLFAGEMVLNGTFQGENLYVKNPFAASGVGFCVYEVTVNGQTTTDEINSSAFEVDLTVYEFSIGQPISVGIKYKEDCAPKVLNPEVLNARATFDVTNINVTDGKISWTSKNEAGSLPYVIEQYRWNKWVKVGEINGKGTATESKYEAEVRQHAGENKFRIKQVDYRKKPRYSDEVTFISTKAEVTLSSNKVDDVLTFTAPTLYEIYDEYGGIVFKGYSGEVNVASLEKGKYYINYDNKMEQFTKK